MRGIKNIMRIKKHLRVVIAAAVIVVAALTVGFMANRVNSGVQNNSFAKQENPSPASNAAKDIFTNPAVDANTRIEAFLLRSIFRRRRCRI
jgi:hypothetical protein